ncbi:peroxiredoxin-like family protein [Pontivivens insulae]|uniref:Thioredoxin domain-containing protein n=1 Tax=Pontivivens insulae TaxID=1639689 RepID=A0A2R8AAJ7_9RHOB|nr:peroxiredoxin-like family protein [Pontivivens insulae]RED13016.1 peroxiredoxin [Pontivivens insulae]SPF29108.1 hypothetical protein POI8812_01414 [Pontivivens insulae]
MAQKLDAGSAFPKMTVPMLGGGELALGTPTGDHDWQMVVVYRGKHCPLCTKYLKELTELLPEFEAQGVDVVAVSADSEAQASAQRDEVAPTFPIGYGLTIAQMTELGVYISDPRSDKETDHPFPEPGLFIINGEGNIQILDISNAPFSRPDLGALARGIRFIRANDYPVRGTHSV